MGWGARADRLLAVHGPRWVCEPLHCHGVVGESLRLARDRDSTTCPETRRERQMQGQADTGLLICGDGWGWRWGPSVWRGGECTIVMQW